MFAEQNVYNQNFVNRFWEYTDVIGDLIHYVVTLGTIDNINLVIHVREYICKHKKLGELCP